MKEQKERVKLLEKEVTLYKEILKLKRQLNELDQPKRIDPVAPTDYWPYWKPEIWSDSTTLLPQVVNIC